MQIMAFNVSTSLGSSRRLLRSLRELMADEGDTQARLDHMVSQIAREMVADVCSIYLRRSDGSMELCATEGLKREAVHRTRMNEGEGLVGLVAESLEPISLSDAPQHKRFSYRPETGEDPYQSFLGVPMLRAGRLIGVLVVQNQAKRTYPEDEIDILQTIATVLGEIVSTTDLSTQLSGFEIKPSLPETLHGKAFAKGLVRGIALLHAPEVAPTRLLAEDPDLEEVRMKEGLRDLRNGLDKLLTGEAHTIGGVSLEVLEMISLLAQDRSWEKRLMEGVRAGLTAEAAVEQVRSEHRARMMAAKDQYLRDRLHDLEELDNRLLRHLAGANNLTQDIPAEAILVARDIGPAELLEYANTDLRAILLEEGTSSGHAAIIARAMGIPMLGQIRGLLARIEAGDNIIVDTNASAAYIRYDPMVLEAFETRFLAQSVERKRVSALKDVPSVTRDGKNIRLLMNAGLVLDLEQLDQCGAQGVGLFRTEFQFMVSNKLPRVDAQATLYQKIFENAGNKPITFRTLDLGGDKIARFMQGERDENPAMGWRALRLGLDKKAVLVYQLRALLRSAEDKHLRVMFPLVSVISEFREAKAILIKEVEWAIKQGRKPPSKLEIGAMIEAPSIAWSIAEIAQEADFLSIGTNDLMQFFFASDRGSPKLADRYDVLSKPALSFLRYIKQNAKDTPISICGEHAGRPLEAMALIAIGFDILSMPPSGIASVKELILATDLGVLTNFVEKLLSSDCQDIRGELSRFAESNGILI
jgi:phosphotransferase system, enzyme I, PtsP